MTQNTGSESKKNPATLLTGFSTNPADYTTPTKICDWRYCNQHVGKNALPCCPVLEKLLNERDVSFEEYFFPPDFTWPPQPKTDKESGREYQFRLIDNLVHLLNWWITETVRSDGSIFWYYAYSDQPCDRRLFKMTIFADLLIQSVKYDFPAVATEIEKLGEAMKTKAYEWDGHAQLMRHRGFIELDPRKAIIFDPIQVKEAAAVLRGELLRIREYLIEQDTAALSDGGDMVYTDIDCAKRTVTIGTKTELIKSENQWDFIKLLITNQKQGKITPILEGSKNHKNVVDVLRRKFDKSLLKQLVLSDCDGYYLAPTVQITNNGQVCIRKTKCRPI